MWQVTNLEKTNIEKLNLSQKVDHVKHLIDNHLHKFANFVASLKTPTSGESLYVC